MRQFTTQIRLQYYSLLSKLHRLKKVNLYIYVNSREELKIVLGANQNAVFHQILNGIHRNLSNGRRFQALLGNRGCGSNSKPTQY